MEKAQAEPCCNESISIVAFFVSAARTLTGISFTQLFRAGFSGCGNAFQTPPRPILRSFETPGHDIFADLSSGRPGMFEPAVPESVHPGNGFWVCDNTCPFLSR